MMKQFLPGWHTPDVSPSAAPKAGGESDEVLMERLRQGDVRAFDALFERHADAIHRFLTLRLGDAARAEDLTQETFLSVIRARGRYLVGRSFRNGSTRSHRTQPDTSCGRFGGKGRGSTS